MSEKIRNGLGEKMASTAGVLPDEQDLIRKQEPCFAIYQVKDGQAYRNLRFASLDELQQPVDKKNYDLVYIGDFPGYDGRNDHDVLEGIYARFNLYQPEEYSGRSVSVSDVIVLKQQEEIRSYYTDSFGFKPLPDFLPENALRNAEMAMEDDYGMIDGIINNGPKQESKMEVPAVLEQTPAIHENLPKEHRHHNDLAR